MGPIRRALREATRAGHDRVDRAFGRFDLASPRGYAGFLTAHAVVLPAIEAELAAAAAWPLWSARGPALMRDLADLGVEPPACGQGRTLHGDADAWGALYVLEGARLGGQVLSARVGRDLPRRYLGDPGEGGWPAFLAALERASPASDAAWSARAARAAKTVFEAFERAADEVFALA